LARQTNIKLRRSATAGAIPTTSNLDLGELALNTYDGKLYMKTTEGSLDSVIQVGSSTDSYFKIRKSLTLSFEVKVVAKTADHKYYNQGSSLGYHIDGIESPHLMLVPGNTYKFDQSDSSNSGHPLRFYYEADKTTAYTTGVTTSGTPGSSGAYTQIVPTGDTPMCLYYQCSAHGYMGNKASFLTRNLTGFDTGDLTEGSNLYFTNARVDARLEATDHTIDGNGSSGGVTISDGNVQIKTGTGSVASVDFYCESNNAHRVRLKAPAHSNFSGNPDVILPNSSGTLALLSDISVTDAGGDGSLSYNNSTGVITYTGPSAAEVRAHFSAGTGVAISSGQISIGQAVATSSNVTFNNVTVDGTLTSDDITSTNISVAGNATITGNLTVSGTTTTVNSSTLDVADKNITINKGSGDTSGTADGAGITIQDAVSASTDATLLWDATNDRFDFSHPVTIVNNDTDDTLLLTSTEASSTAAPVLTLKRNSGSPADADYLGQVKFKGENDADQEVVFAKVTGKIQDASDGSEDGILEFANIKAGSQTITARLRSDSFQLLNNTNLIVRGLTYPTSDGSNGQALVTDGSGNLSFSSISAGGNAFGTIAVSGQSDVVADSNSDTLTLVAGSNITLTTNAGGDSVTIAASGGGSSITVQDEGSALSTALGTLNFVGAGVTASGTGATKTITIPGTGTVSEAFKTIAVSGSSDIVADSATDTLTLVAGSNMTITQNASSDTITFASSGGSSTSAADIRKKFVYTTSGSTTAFSGSDDNSQTLSYTTGAVDVFLNGVLQKLTTDYAETNSSTITFVNAIPSGNVVEIVAYYRTIGTGNSVVDQFTGNGSTTAFTVTTAPADEKNLMVYIDGVYQQKTDYTVSGTTLTFDTAPASGATIETVSMVGAITTQGALTLTGALTGTSGDFSSDFSIAGNLLLDGDNKELRFYEGSNFVGFEAPALSGDQIWVLPDADGSSGHALKTDGSGNLSWGTAGGNAFDKVAVSGQSNIVADSTTDTLTFAAGTGITLTTTPGTDTLTITNSATGANAFGTIAVSGQTSVAADSTGDTLTLEAGAGITLTTDASTDKVTIAGGSGSVFTTDLFTASGSGSALLSYTLSTTPSSENELICFIEGVYQNKNSYSLSGTTLTFDSGIVSGQEIVVHHVGAGVVGVSPTIDTFTGDGSTTGYTLSLAPPNENYLSVFWDGVYQHHSEYSVSGTTLTFTAAAPNSTAIEVHIPSVNGIGTPSDGTVTPAKLSTGGPSWDTNSNQIVGSHYVRSDSTSISSTSATTVATHAIASFRSVNYKVQVTQGSSYYQSEINVLHDGSTAYITEFGVIDTFSSNPAFDATISSGNLLLQVTMPSNNSSTIKVMSTATTV